MNYQNYAGYHNYPPQFGKPKNPLYDRAEGIEPINENNLTITDIYRTPFLFLQEHHKNYTNMASTALKGTGGGEDQISTLFFSDSNILRIQKLIKREVYYRTSGKFVLEADQDNNDIFILMRAVYLENARFLNNVSIVRQVKRLNKKVIDEAIPGIITNIKQEYGYQLEINKPLTMIPRPINAGNAGRRTLPAISTVLGM